VRGLEACVALEAASLRGAEAASVHGLEACVALEAASVHGLEACMALEAASMRGLEAASGRGLEACMVWRQQACVAWKQAGLCLNTKGVRGLEAGCPVLNYRGSSSPWHAAQEQTCSGWCRQ